MPITLSQTGLEIGDPKLRALFADLQGNILKAHGRDHSRHIFIRFKADAKTCRNWVQSFAQRVTSALEQHRTARDFEATGTEHIFTGFMLTCTGYQALEIEDHAIPDDKAFRAGMKNLEAVYDTGPDGVHRRSVNPLNDDLGCWEDPFLQQIDALILFAYGGANCAATQCSHILDTQAEETSASLKEVAEIISVQSGFALRNELGHVMEHFGYADGVSNPQFMKSDLELSESSGTDHYDSSGPVGLVLVQDAGGKLETDSFGSYFVYRKLQQNIKGFNDRVQDLANALSATNMKPADPELAGALVIGRFKDGTPISLQRQPGLKDANNFSFEDDMDGVRCPLQAHVRKTNPRADTYRMSGVPLRVERSKRIVRRGISYGETDLNPSAEWSDAGLLFLSCQSDIEQQFIVMHGGWANNPNFLASHTGIDPVIGQSGGAASQSSQLWPTGAENNSVELSFSGFVRCRGGEYFFAPSISFLQGLSETEPPTAAPSKN